MSLLTIVQGACQVIGIPSPSSVIGNADTNVAQMLALVNLVGVDLARAKNWSELVVDSTWTTISGEDQGVVTAVIGSDFDRFAPGTIWDRSLIRPLPGPRSPQGWAQDHAFIAAGPFYNFRIYGSPSHVRIFPAPTVGETLSWEYLSKNWCTAANGGTGKTAFSLDTDVAKFDETLIQLNLIVRYKGGKGLRFDTDLISLQDCKEERFGTNGGNPRTLRIGGGIGNMPWPVIPDGNWPTS